MKQYCDAVLNNVEIIDSTHTYKNIDLVLQNPSIQTYQDRT